MLRFVQRETVAGDFKKPAGMDDTIYSLLLKRGIKSDEEAVAFLNPESCAMMDPYKFDGMEAAVQRIYRAREDSESVCVFGDYDVDGACATAILLKVLRGAGINVTHYIPSRSEGYGLNEAAIRAIADRASLLITVDCGISAISEVALAVSLSMDVIVTDHHQIREALPSAIILHPGRGEGVYPHFCGAGVAWMLASAVDRIGAESVLDLASLATVADLVPLTGMNRTMVKQGLSMINGRPRPGIAALIEVSGLTPGDLTSENIAFQLAPRLNASGRLFSAEESLALILCEDLAGAKEIALRLNEYNDQRRAIEARILKSAQEKIMALKLAGRGAIVVEGEDWHAGVVGLVASRLVEYYGLPAIVLSREEGGMFVGSIRSVPDIDIMDALSAVAHLLQRFGGHRQAAGLTIREEDIAPFREAIDQYILSTAPPEAFIKRIEYDLDLPLSKINERLIGKLKALEPFGLHNPEPVFLSKGRVKSARAVGKDNSHLQLRLVGESEKEVRGIWFRHGALSNRLSGEMVTALYCPRLNEFRGVTNVDLMMIAILGDVPLSEERITEMLPSTAFRFLTAVVNGQTQGLAPISEDEAIEAFRTSPRGTLVVTHSFRAGKHLSDRLLTEGLSERLDVFVGAWPEDPRGMNALCIMPVGDPPDYYETSRFLPGERGEFSPSVDALRETLLALRALFKKPYHFSGFGTFSQDLSEESGVSVEKCVAGLVILKDMALIEVDISPLHCQVLCPVRKNPEDNLAFIRLKALQ